MTKREYIIIDAKVEPGTQQASGTYTDRFGDATIKLQQPGLAKGGFDLAQKHPGFKLGTINGATPFFLWVKEPYKTVENLDWHPDANPENFSFMRCRMSHNGKWYKGWIYYPHPESKPEGEKHTYSRIEIICRDVPGLNYGDDIKIMVNKRVYEIMPATESTQMPRGYNDLPPWVKHAP